MSSEGEVIPLQPHQDEDLEEVVVLGSSDSRQKEDAGDDDDEEDAEADTPYEMSLGDDGVCGLCVIINVINFTKRGFKKREGSQHDGSKIKSTFRNLGFKVEKLAERDLKKDRIKEYLRGKARSYKDSWSCFVCFVLSHGGDEDTFADTSGERVSVSSLVRCFDCKSCPQMKGKPKLFFVQKCRGKKKMKGVKVVSDAEDDDDDAPLQFLDPDTLISFCTTPGFIAYRKAKAGSDYVQHFVQLLDKHGADYDLQRILRMMADYVSSQDYQVEEDDDNLYKMCPTYRNTLLKRLVFHRIRPQGLNNMMRNLCISSQEDP